ncbi:zinc finger protein 708-like [Leptopilina heterotoma]|uniref:zinc finger protein 708-like n=1 Tax=Leptopilina heterotoma TaxID=63436 RepID=UPI001CA9A8F3|nr:zinc finger protein 708-like [Leptopilina heterotoma]
MTNSRQSDVGHASGLEHSQEEVQLTELLPVEQYRIQESSDFTDSGATDALKALRSFSQTNQQTTFVSDEFNFYDHYDEVDPLSICEERAPEWNEDDDEEEEEEEEDYKLILSEESTKSEIVSNDDFQNEFGNQSNGKIRGRRKIKRSTTVNDEKGEEIVELSDDSMNEETIEDEIYAFQDEMLFQQDEDEMTEEDPLKIPDKSDDLRVKISAIIKANILLEQDNNNVEEEGLQDVRKKEKKGFCKTIKKEAKKYICVICNSEFKGSGGLRNHYKVAHATGPVYKCDECGKEFPLKERLKLHVRTHTGFKPYKCLECDKSFARGGQLVQHRRTHSQVKPYHCSLCSGTFTCAANLALHMKRHNGQKDHKCEICGRGFVRRDALKKHMECLHHDVKSFLCVICNKTLKGHLPQHMRTHAQDRPHGCATCGQRFAQKSQLTVHQRTHSGQRPFRCLVCWQAFAHSTALKLHTRRHTGERPFKCEECNAGFTQLPHWKKHMKCIHGRNEPYCCRRCKTFFRIKSELECHQKDCKKSEKMNSEDDGQVEVFSDRIKYRVMPIEKMRLLLAVLLKRISKPEKLDELGFGKRLIDEVLHDSLISAGKVPVKGDGNLTEFDCLKKNVEIFLEWTVPKSHWAKFKKMKKTPEEILETLTTSAND